METEAMRAAASLAILTLLLRILPVVAVVSVVIVPTGSTPQFKDTRSRRRQQGVSNFKSENDLYRRIFYVNLSGRHGVRKHLHKGLMTV